MIVPVLLTLFSLQAQSGGRLSGETGTPMTVRSPNLGACKLDVSGTVRVTKSSVAANRLVVRDLKARGVRAVTGVLRLHSAFGRFQEKVIRYELIGSRGVNRLTMPPSSFDISPPATIDRIEGLITGAYFEDGTVCGENAEIAKGHYQQALADGHKDAEEAIALAAKLSATEFESRIKRGALIPLGPYSRGTTAGFNQRVSLLLLSPSGQLIASYKTALHELMRSLTPAKP